AEEMIVIQAEQAGISLVRRGHVDECQTDAGENLHDQESQRRTAKYIPPAHRAGRPARDRVHKHRQDAIAHFQSSVKPASDGTQPGHAESLAITAENLRSILQCVLQRRKMWRPNFQLAVAHLPDTLEQWPRRRSGSVITVLVIDPSVTGAHE